MDYAPLEEFLVGRCGLTEHQAALTSFAEYRLRLKGEEQRTQERWELARWICFNEVQLSPNIKPHAKPRTPQAFVRFPWEKQDARELERKAEAYAITQDEINELNKIFQELERHENR